MEFFPYGKTEVEWLKSRDPVLGGAIDAIGEVRRAVMPNLFEALIYNVVGQQISTKAHVTIWARFIEKFGPLAPETLANASVEEIQKCGTSLRKADYILNIARAVLEKRLDLDELSRLPEDDVCKELCRLKGIGVWTAEMLLIFSMMRPNVLSYGDLAILRGLRMLYNEKEINRAAFDGYKERYAPYATVAGLYLWAVAGGAIEGLVDPKE